MEHEQGAEVLGRYGSYLVFSTFGMAITEVDHTILALQNILHADDAPVYVTAKINKGLFDVAPSWQSPTNTGRGNHGESAACRSSPL